jgi:hypothetical protein
MTRLERHIFALDGLGAAASMLGTAYVLPALEPWIGLPFGALHALAAPAALFAVYSLSCWMLRAPTRPWLPVIMVANLAYCVFVAWYLARHVGAVTPWGWAYFVGEAGVVAGVVRLEWGVLVGRSAGERVAHTEGS